MKPKRVVIVGAGVGGLAAAADLARSGMDVTVLESGAAPGGKMREVTVGGRKIDSGPTVLTMRWVFESLFNDCGVELTDALSLTPLDILARHAWSTTEQFDLHANTNRTSDAVGDFAGAAEAHRYRAFARDAARIYGTLKDTFLCAPRPNPVLLARRIGLHRPGALLGIRPFDTLWSALGNYFRDPRLRQLFARYATYSGSSPFSAPATLMLIAHVEQEGVWTVAGGMQNMALALARLAEGQGAKLQYNSSVEEIIRRDNRVCGIRLQSGERIEADAIVVNADCAAIASGLLGKAVSHAVDPLPSGTRSLSAITWTLIGNAQGIPLHRHNVFFGPDYQDEFDALFRRSSITERPTVYICAQDRPDEGSSSNPAGERLLLLVNAPPIADTHTFTSKDINACKMRVFQNLERCGLQLRELEEQVIATTPNDFNRLYPGTGGALYGRATHGWAASFQRPPARTKVQGLYVAGGTAHPGAGVPMAVLSGRLAAQQLIEDHRSMWSSRQADMSGGMSMR